MKKNIFHRELKFSHEFPFVVHSQDWALGAWRPRVGWGNEMCALFPVFTPSSLDYQLENIFKTPVSEFRFLKMCGTPPC